MFVSGIELNRIETSLLRILPRFSPQQQRLGITVYRLLAEGKPVARARIAAAVGVPEDEVSAVLASESLRPFVYDDDRRRVIGFGGLAIVPMHHRWSRSCFPTRLGATPSRRWPASAITCSGYYQRFGEAA